jgi:hypothetical protein
MQKLSTAAAIAATEKLSEKQRNFVNQLFYTFNVEKTKTNLSESEFLIPKF